MEVVHAGFQDEDEWKAKYGIIVRESLAMANESQRERGLTTCRLNMAGALPTLVSDKVWVPDSCAFGISFGRGFRKSNTTSINFDFESLYLSGFLELGLAGHIHKIALQILRRNM